MVAEVNGGIATDEPEFSGDCGSASEVSKTAFLEPGVFRTRVLETCVVETVEKKPKSLKGLGSTVRRVWLEGAISRGAKFVRKRR
jgi:hypothetical protein